MSHAVLTAFVTVTGMRYLAPVPAFAQNQARRGRGANLEGNHDIRHILDINRNLDKQAAADGSRQDSK